MRAEHVYIRAIVIAPDLAVLALTAFPQEHAKSRM